MKIPKKHLPANVKETAVKAILKKEQLACDVAKTLGVNRTLVYKWIRQYKKEKSLVPLNQKKRGPAKKITPKIAKNLFKILKKPATFYGYTTDFWTTKRIAQVLKTKFGFKVSIMSVFRELVKHEYSYRKPERRYYETDTKQQKEWQKKVVPNIKRTVNKHKAILYFQDEANINLQPVTAKTWAPIREKAVVKSTSNRGSISVISAISHDGRLIFNIHDQNKRYCADDIIHFLEQMLQHHPHRHLVVVMDQAPCHTAKKVKSYINSQKRLHVFYLPPRSPELNPDEKVWNHLKHQELQSHQAKNLDELKKLTKKKLKKMATDTRVLKGIFHRSEISKFF